MKTLKHIHIVLFLIPLFFIVHSYYEIGKLVPLKEISILFFYFSILNLILYFALSLFIKSKNRINFYIVLINLLNFFSNSFQDWLKKNVLHSLSFHTYLLIVFVFLISFIIIDRKKNFNFNPILKFNKLIFIVFIFIDVALIQLKTINSSSKVNLIENKSKFIFKDSEKSNSIYILVFDEYSSIKSLKENYNYSNPLDSLLTKNGFTIFENSFSNYDATRMSIASILNFDYLNINSNQSKIDLNDYNYALGKIKNNKTFKLFADNNYELYNFSIFDIAGTTSIVNSKVFPQKSLLITQRTLLSRIRKLIIPELQKVSFLQKIFLHPYEQQIKDNEYIYNKTIQATTIKNKKVVYAHFLLPHLPFYKDSLMNNVPFSEYSKDDEYDNERRYLNFLPYVNLKIKNLIESINANDPNATIIIMSDHGYRQPKINNRNNSNFKNLLAIKNYSIENKSSTDSISMVNLFRYYFNSKTSINLPIIKDSLIRIVED